MGRIAAVVALFLAVCAAAAPAGTEPERVYALLSDSPPAVLAEVDARTLQPVSSARVELARVGLWSFSPDGEMLAVSNGWVLRSGLAMPVQLRFVDLVGMRLTGSVRLGPDPGLTTGYVDPVVLVSWITQDTVVAIRQRADRRLELVGVDYGKRTIRWRTPLSGVVLASAAVGGELDGLGVRYHERRGTFAKYLSGAERQAVSLGGGMLAVAGSNSAVEKSDGKLYQLTRASGLELVDTRTGTTRSIDATATGVASWHGGLVSASQSWDSRLSQQRGGGLAIYDSAGVLQARLLEGRSVSLVGVRGDLAYAYDGDRITVDLVARKVIGRGAKPFPLLR